MTTNLSPKFLAHGAVLVTLLALTDLSGCADARRALGVEKAPPDEFAVVANAPLSQPPDYTLRPPTPGAPRPQEGTTTDRAHEALTGVGVGGASAPSQGEKEILTKAGADVIVPDIRHKVDEETTGLAVTSTSFVDSLLFWQADPIPGEPIDAIRESQRLKENAAAGRSPTAGDSVFISREAPTSTEHWYSWFW
jgi:hypothetical protein